VSHWLDDAARGLADGSHNRREVLRRGGAIAASTLLGSAVSPLRAFASSRPCTPASCPDGICCEGRCLVTGILGCCHDRIYARLSKTCCPEAPAGGGHTCLDGEECCGKTKCCTGEQLCCDGRCLPGPRTRVGCCHGATYDKRAEECCPEQPRGALEFHVCLKDEECCGEKECCRGEQLCCDGRCLPGPRTRVGCCNGATYDKRSEQCCLEQPSGALEFHVCAKDEECCGEKACCTKGQECCGSGATARCVAKGKCKEHCVTPGFPPTYTPCGDTCCGGSSPVCCNLPPGPTCCAAGQVCCGDVNNQCVTPAPAGQWHLSNYDGAPGEEVACCPGGSAGTCGINRGESHPACRGGNFGCVCTGGSFCPVEGCCDSSGNCLNPCP